MNNLIESIIIVGGGTAGWLTAGIIAARHRSRINRGELTITLVESEHIATVGVGEGTWPTMPNTLRSMGVSETDFIRECNASFKQGSKFVNWDIESAEQKNNEVSDSFYYHPFDVPNGAMEGDIASYWLNENCDQSLAALFTSQEALCNNKLAPKTISTPEYSSFSNYGYHLDAGKFSNFLRQHCVDKLGVNHVVADVDAVTLGDSGDIKSLTLSIGTHITADFFIDCSGFKSLLLGEALGVGYTPVNDILFADTALAMQVPYDNDNDDIASYTQSTAQTAGWIWDIGLPSRRGVGYVYASKYQSRESAEHTLRTYVEKGCTEQNGIDTTNLMVKEIKFQAGHRDKFFEKNCVAIGLSSGFLEPLEAASLVMVELSATMIAEQLPTTKTSLPIIAKRFNERFIYRWERVIEFLKLHYIVSNRTTPFWQDNKQPDTIPERLKEQMSLWQHNVPTQFDFTQIGEVFQAASYQFVLYGSQFKTQAIFSLDPSVKAFACEQVAQNKQRTAQLLSTLPSNRELINQIYQYGFKKI